MRHASTRACWRSVRREKGALVDTDHGDDGAERAARDRQLERIENAVTGLNRVINGREADRFRMRRADVTLTLPRMSLLRALHDRGPMRVVDLGAINHMDKGYASRAWRSLAAEGYLQIVPSEDPRSTTVALTEHGRDVYLRWRRVNTEILGDALAGWRGRDLDALSDLLERLLTSFRELRPPP
jgi:DNA-binding MarR family transcriptional regulator